MKQKIYNYKPFPHLIGTTILPIMLLIGTTLIFLSVTIGLIAQILNLSTRVQVNDSPLFLFLTFLLCGLFYWISLSLHVSRPAIEVNEGQFRLRTLLYKSQWLGWNDISDLKLPDLPIVSDYVIEADKLNILFLLTSLNTGATRRAFVIGKNIRGYDELLAHIRKERQDLFKSK